MEISLRDVSLMDAPSKLISSTTASNPKTFPISYRIEYNPSDIKPGYVYALSVRITGSDGKLLYINDVRTIAPLAETASSNVDIAVIRGNLIPFTASPIVNLFFQLEVLLAVRQAK